MRDEHNDLAFPMLALGSAGFLQFDVQPALVEANLAEVKLTLRKLEPPVSSLVVLPELWATGFAYKHLPELTAATPALLGAMQELAAKYGIYLVGSLLEAVTIEEKTAVFNTLYVVGTNGVVGSYRKQQLFTPMGEERYFTPGTNPQPVELAEGCLGLLVCYDLRFPDLAHHQAVCGAALLVVSAQWPMARLSHWRILLQARAIENQLFVVACNRCGVTDNVAFAGHSMVVAPDGAILTEAGENREGKVVKLVSSRLAAARSRFNSVMASPWRFNDQDKIVNLSSLRGIVARYKGLGRKVVFTNGCFDVLHVGHVTYLEAARKKGDCLIVGLNSDDSIRAIKGSDRPVNHEASRARVLSSLGCVDYVVLFKDNTPYHLITALMPDFLVKGGDWPLNKIVGAAEVSAGGGQVSTVPLVENFSTTALIEQLKGTLKN